MSQAKWTAVDDYFVERLVGSDAALDFALSSSAEAGLPAHAVAPNQGKLLYLLARLCGAQRILEIGTLGGYSTIWLGRAVAPAGRVVSLEISEDTAQLARRSIEQAGLSAVVEIRTGAAIDSMQAMIDAAEPAFDLIFIDADKPNNPRYLALALQLAKVGTVIIGDNVVRDGAVVDATSQDANVQGVRAFFEAMAATPGLTATALQTVGSKGYDGFSIALVEARPVQAD